MYRGFDYRSCFAISSAIRSAFFFSWSVNSYFVGSIILFPPSPQPLVIRQPRTVRDNMANLMSCKALLPAEISEIVLLESSLLAVVEHAQA